MKILIINGVNLNMLGQREKEFYGERTLQQINDSLQSSFPNIEFDFFQSNIEGEIVSAIHRCDADALIINAGAYTHYSYAIADALKIVKVPKIEVHMSNIMAREDFRAKSVIAPSCTGSISGFGESSYTLAVQYCKLAL